METAIVGGGCFWCTEAVFLEMRGVKSVVSGYCGGRVPNPTYQQVCTGGTGHAEVVRIEYDPAEVSYEDILEVFLLTHDPTTLNRQGNDVGTQYRSAIFYASEAEQERAAAVLQRLEQEQVFDGRIVTTLEPLTEFYPAEDYHQNYYRSNPRQSYCTYVVGPKVAKFRQKFQRFLKSTAG